MSSVLEILSLEELYTRKENLLKQIKKVDDEIDTRINDKKICIGEINTIMKDKKIKIKIVKKI